MGRFAKSFRDLEVYKNGMVLAVEIHEFCKTLPAEERYSFADQMRRASRSVCANISEAWRKRRYLAAFVSKLSDAETEAAEIQAWLDFCLRLKYMRSEQYNDFDSRYERILSQLVRMIREPQKWCTMQHK